jgi:hypothetical protein
MEKKVYSLIRDHHLSLESQREQIGMEIKERSEIINEGQLSSPVSQQICEQ